MYSFKKIPGIIILNLIVIFLITVISSCNSNKTEKLLQPTSIPVNDNKVNDSLLGYGSIICDTCTSIVVVLHEESTESKDLLVDSGTVYIPPRIYNMYDSLIKNNRIRKDVLNSMDLYLDKPKDLYKLWPNFPAFYNHRYYRVRGKIVRIDKGGSLYFRILSYKLLDTTKYTRRWGVH